MKGERDQFLHPVGDFKICRGKQTSGHSICKPKLSNTIQKLTILHGAMLKKQ